MQTDDCFVYGKDRELYGADRNEALATNVENAEDCQFICQEKIYLLTTLSTRNFLVKTNCFQFQTVPNCEYFNYRLDNGSCQLLPEEAGSKPWVTDKNVIHGPRICPTGDTNSPINFN